MYGRCNMGTRRTNRVPSSPRWLVAVGTTLGLLGAGIVLAPPAASDPATPTTPATWVANGSVDALVVDGTTAYLGGTFTSLGPSTGGSAALAATGGAPSSTWPKVTGTVSAITSDGAGGWFLGGSFTAVGGAARTNLAHVLADETVDPGWAPSPNSSVKALALVAGTLYVGGTFTASGGWPRGLAAVDATTGVVDTSWSASPGLNADVNALAVVGTTLYAGGAFSGRLAAISLATGVIDTTWQPDPRSGNPDIKALAVAGTTLYVAGGFTNITNITNRNSLVRFDTTTGNLDTAWNPNPFGGVLVNALAVDGTTLYAGGNFTTANTIGGQARNRLAAIDITPGAV
ncbi:MAG: hypothetical protein JWO68_2293, partial [Actinomycetia bacterium]|nr:hypothetical protein [Actinomycetes bacterium]